MNVMASQITCNSIVYSTDWCSGWHKKHFINFDGTLWRKSSLNIHAKEPVTPKAMTPSRQILKTLLNGIFQLHIDIANYLFGLIILLSV